VVWSYSIVDGDAYLYGMSSPAPVTSANDTLRIPSTLGGCPVVEIEGGINSDWNTELFIPSSVTSVRHLSIQNAGYYSYTNRLQRITVDSGNTYYKSIDGCLYTKDGKTFVRCPQGRIGKVTVASGVQYIADHAFYGCFGVTEINLPNSVISIGRSSFNCNWSSYASTPSVTYTSLTKINIPSSVRFIGDSAFQDCSKLDIDLVIPEGVQRIGTGAFNGCSSIKSLSLPESLVEIGYQAFNGCTKMTTQFSKMPSNVVRWDLKSFGGCDQMKLDYEIGHGATEISDWQFERVSCLRSIIIPNTVMNIGKYAFNGCASLSSVSIGNNVKNIDTYAFYGCTSLKNIRIPNSVMTLSTYSFYGCSSLERLEFIGLPPESISISTWTWGLPSGVKIYYYQKYSEQWNKVVPTTSSYFGGYLD
jgi:hypothetical protein